MMGRRVFLLALASLAALAAWAPQASADSPGATTPKFYVVEIANFGCPHCRDMQSYQSLIASQIQALGGEFDFAPVVWDSQPPARDWAYYAARNQGAAVAQAVEQAMFSAVQDSQLPLENLGQVMAWLQQTVPATADIDYSRLLQDASSTAAQDAETRAEELAMKVNVTVTPTYVMVQNGGVAGAWFLSQSGETPAQLASSVVSGVQGVLSKH